MRHRKSNVNFPAILFREGLNYRAYDYFGVHKMTGKYSFRLWAPGADSVRVILFYPDGAVEVLMDKIFDDGIWEAFLHTIEFVNTEKVYSDPEGVEYVYKVEFKDKFFYKNDPFSLVYSKSNPKRSVVSVKSSFSFNDSLWEFDRFQIFYENRDYRSPLNIFDARDMFVRSSFETSLLKEISTDLVSFVKKMGYTHVLLPSLCDSICIEDGDAIPRNLFSISALYGTRDDLKRLVNRLHGSGIGVIMDFMPSHFAREEFGVDFFDSGTLYEDSSKERISNVSDQVSRYDVRKNQIVSYLISSAFYWLDKFHLDGLRLVQTDSLFDLNHNKPPTEWITNRYGTFENLEGFFFLNQLNEAVRKYYPDRVMIVDNNDFFHTQVINKFNKDLGFDFKISFAWISDLRNYIHGFDSGQSLKLLSGNYILPFLSHEVLLKLAPEIYGEQMDVDTCYALKRCLKTLQMTFPAKKIDFSIVGSHCTENKTSLEANEDSERCYLHKYKIFVENINKFYKKACALYDNDWSFDGLKFIPTTKKNILAFSRTSLRGTELVVVINFSNEVANGIVIPSKNALGYYQAVLNSNEKRFGGSGVDLHSRYRVRKKTMDFELDLPPLSAVILEPKANTQ